MRGPGSISTGGNILSRDFFHIVKPPMPILALLPMLCVCENPDFAKCFVHYLNKIQISERLEGVELPYFS